MTNGNVNPDSIDDEDHEDVDDLILHKSASRISHGDFEVNYPRGQLLLVTLELAGLLVEIAVCITVLVTQSWGHKGTIAAIAKLVSWSYIFVLAAVRFILSALDKQIKTQLWNHTASLYGIQWLLIVFVFRSEIIHPHSQRALILSSIEFAVCTLLVILATTTRRGNKSVLLQREDGLEPPSTIRQSLVSHVFRMD